MFDEFVIFQPGYSIVSTDVVGSKLEMMINHQCDQGGNNGNIQDLNVRSSAYRFWLKKKRLHALIWERRAVEASRWVEFSTRQAWGDFSINALLK